MSWLSKAVKGAKKLVTNPGKALENIGRSVGGAVKAAAPVLNVIPGVGPIAAAGLGALGSVASGGNMKDHLKTAAVAGGSGLLGGALGAASKIPGVSTAVNAIKGLPGAGAITSGVSKVQSIADLIGKSGLGQAARTLNGGQAITLGNLIGDGQKNLEKLTDGNEGGLNIGGLLGGVGDFVTGNNGLNALGIAQGINAANLQKQSTQYAKDAMGQVQGSYNERAPLRAQGIQGLLNPQTQDISELSAIRGRAAQGAPSTQGLPQAMGAGAVQPVRGLLNMAPQMPSQRVSNPQALQSIAGLMKIPAGNLAGNATTANPQNLQATRSLLSIPSIQSRPTMGASSLPQAKPKPMPINIPGPYSGQKPQAISQLMGGY